MSKKNLFKSKTNFTLKRLHQSGSFGNIYERDYTTIAGTTASPEGQIPVYSSPSFKLSIRGGYNGQKKYKYCNWEENNASCNENSQKWTLGCLPVANTNDSKIILKPNSKRLTDFAYFASASELIRATISDIVAKFPAEVLVTDKTLLSTGILSSDSIPTNSSIRNYSSYYLIDNPFLIDLTQLVIPENSEVSPLRYMCASYEKCNIITDSNTIIPVKEWEVSSEQATDCIENGTKLATITFKGENGTRVEIIGFYIDGNIIYITTAKNYRIRPNDEHVNLFYKNLDDFGKILLNQYTDYTAKFETYEETDEYGWQMSEKDYKWPTTKGGWNLAVKGKTYNKYVNDLTELSLGYDSLYTDMIWRTMTHEAIVNLDLTLSRNGDMVEIPNSSKLKQMLNIFGRQFDEIKKYADNLKNTHVISYDQNGNSPDYFVPDSLNNSGWEVKNVLNNISNDIITNPMYGARTLGYTAGDANAEFMRRLKLNSKNIFAKKGTKQAIEDLLAVFGYHSTDWIRKHLKITNIPSIEPSLRKAYMMFEYSYVTNGYNNDKSGTTLVNKVREINQLKDNFPTEDINNDQVIDFYYGLPVAEVSKIAGYKICRVKSGTTAGEYEKPILANKKVYTVTDIKNFPTEHLTDYDYIFYNNLYFEWDNTTGETLIPWFDKNLKYDGGIYFQSKGGWAGYEETGLPTRYEQTCSRIHYVYELNDLYELSYNVIDESGLYYVESEKTYYKIKNINQYQNPEGWTKNGLGKDIADAESIIDNNKGNNPHMGNYDNGNEYKLAYGELFKNSTFNNARYDESEAQAKGYGFDIVRQNDNTKTIYLSDIVNLDPVLLRPKGQLKPIDLFTGNVDYTELAGTSIINNKEFHITFDDAHQEFILENVIPYLKQIIPSTTIFTYSFERLQGDDKVNKKAATHLLVCDGDLCPIYGIA